MYNGIGLQTARGSGTNGHVQRNLSFVRQGKKDNVKYKTEAELAKAETINNRPPNEEILEHERKRKIEVKILEFQDVLEEGDYTPEEIAAKVQAYRERLLNETSTDKDTELPKDEFGRYAVRETHQIAAAKHEKNAMLRSAFGISEYFVEGSSFDSDRKAKEELAKSAALQKELDAQRKAIDADTNKRYKLVRTPSKERDDVNTSAKKNDENKTATTKSDEKAGSKHKKKQRDSKSNDRGGRDNKKKRKHDSSDNDSSSSNDDDDDDDGKKATSRKKSSQHSGSGSKRKASSSSDSTSDSSSDSEPSKKRKRHSNSNSNNDRKKQPHHEKKSKKRRNRRRHSTSSSSSSSDSDSDSSSSSSSSSTTSSSSSSGKGSSKNSSSNSESDSSRKHNKHNKQRRK